MGAGPVRQGPRVSAATGTTARSEHPHWCNGEDGWESIDNGITTGRHHTLEAAWFEIQAYEAVQFTPDEVQRTTTTPAISARYEAYGIEEVPEMIRQLQDLYERVTGHTPDVDAPA